jgi:hypothetical protein
MQTRYMDSEQRIAELEARIEKLEADEPDEMSRRDLLQLGGAGLLGALAGGGGSMAAVDRASAGTYQAGSLGTAEDPLDLTADDISVVDSGGVEQGSVDESGIDVPSVTTESINIDTQDTGGHTLTTSRSASTKSLTAKPFSIELFPNDGDDRTHYLICNAPDFDNFGYIKFEVDNLNGLIHADAKGTGTSPTSLLFSDSFTDGIEFAAPTTISPPHGTVSAPETPIEYGSGNNLAAIQSNLATITGDNTQQHIIEPSDPPLNGLIIVIGYEKNNPSLNTFQDLVVAIRNDTISTINKTDGATTMTSRTYSLDSAAPSISIDHSGVTYELNIWYIGGGS